MFTLPRNLEYAPPPERLLDLTNNTQTQKRFAFYCNEKLSSTYETLQSGSAIWKERNLSRSSLSLL